MLEDANNVIKAEGSKKTIKLMSEYYEEQKLKLLIDTRQKRNSDVGGQIVLNGNHLHPIEHETKRSGRPKFNWYLNALDKYWLLLKTKYNQTYRYEPLNLSNINHTNLILQAADEGWGIDI